MFARSLNDSLHDAGLQAATYLTQVCPIAPPGAQAHVNTLQGYTQWAVIALFVFAVFISVGAIVAGRIFNMPMVSKAGIVGLVVVFLAVIAYLVFPGMVEAMVGSGCI